LLIKEIKITTNIDNIENCILKFLLLNQSFNMVENAKKGEERKLHYPNRLLTCVMV